MRGAGAAVVGVVAVAAFGLAACNAVLDITPGRLAEDDLRAPSGSEDDVVDRRSATRDAGDAGGDTARAAPDGPRRTAEATSSA